MLPSGEADVLMTNSSYDNKYYIQGGLGICYRYDNNSANDVVNKTYSSDATYTNIHFQKNQCSGSINNESFNKTGIQHSMTSHLRSFDFWLQSKNNTGYEDVGGTGSNVFISGTFFEIGEIKFSNISNSGSYKPCFNENTKEIAFYNVATPDVKLRNDKMVGQYRPVGGSQELYTFKIIKCPE